MSWFNKRILKKGKKGGAEDWWNKNVKPIGQSKDLWHGIGNTLALTDPFNVSSFITCIGQGKNYGDCVERRAEQGLSGLWQKAGDKQPKFDPNDPNAIFDIPDVPTHTGVDVTTGWDPESGMTQAEYDAIIDEYTDNTTFGDEGAPGGGEGSTETETTEIKRAKPWLYAKGEDKKSNLLALINQMLQDPEPEKMQMGGPVGMGSMMPSRRMYNMPQRKKRPVMQTSTAGMPMRGMTNGMPMMKKGGKVKMPKGWHV